MKIVEPTVRLIGYPTIDVLEMESYLRELSTEAEGWLDRRNCDPNMTDAEILTEFMGRLCYNSFDTEQNENITQTRREADSYFANVINNEDGSIFRHSTVNFVITGVSRNMSHELIRHSVGTAPSEESWRYFRPKEVAYVLPDIYGPDETWATEAQIDVFCTRYLEILTLAESLYLDQGKMLDPSLPMAEKKRLTDGFRYCLPSGQATRIGWSSNLEALRWVIYRRTHPTSAKEIRTVFDQVARLIVPRYPRLFQDFVRQDNGHWSSAHPKI